MSMVASIFLTMGVAIERYWAVCRPHHYREVQSQSHRALLYIVPSLLAATIFNIPKFLETEIATYCVDYTACGCGVFYHIAPETTALRNNETYIKYYNNWWWMFVTGLMPFLVLLSLNMSIYRGLYRLRTRRINRINRKTTLRTEIHQNATGTSLTVQTSGIPLTATTHMCGSDGSPPYRHQVDNNSSSPSLIHKINNNNKHSARDSKEKREANLTLVLIWTVVTFLICHGPRVMVSLYEATAIQKLFHCGGKNMDYTPLWFNYATSSVQTLVGLNCCMNFPIYWMVSNSFRKNFKSLHCIKSN